jgi:hypothetical protein
MSVGRKLRFEPEFRFALEGKPWMYIFWWRYDLINKEKLFFKMRANYGMVFKTIPVTTDSISNEILTANRSLTGDLTANYVLTKNISIGSYYMYIYGVEKHAIRNTHYLAIRTYFSNIRISDKFFIGINPQVYLLIMDADHGFYFNSTFSFARRNFPVSITALINKTIQTSIPIGEDFLWNVGLIYSFNKKYVEQ